MFFQCFKLTTVTIGENSQIMTIESESFRQTAIKSFTIPKITSYIRKGAFQDCESMTSVVIGESVDLKLSAKH